MKSLERRLQKNIAIVTVLTLLGLLFITNLSTRSILTEFVASRLALDAERILNSLIITPSSLNIRWGRLNPVYNIPDSGHYYQVKINNKVMHSPSLQDRDIPLINTLKPNILHDAPGPAGQHLIIWSKSYQINGQIIMISVAENMNQLMEERKKFSLLFMAIGISGFILMLFILRLVIRRLFKHLDSSQQEIRQIVRGERQQLTEDVPAEIYPLVKEFNHSLSIMQQRMERSRNSLGNLAHALKTPLSLLTQQLDNKALDTQKAKNQAERIRQLTERELKRARMAGLGNTSQRFDPREELPTLIEVLKQAHRKDELEVSLHIDDAAKTFGDREDMLELLGNLMDNACKWAKSQVLCSVFIDREVADTITICIEDDGAGKGSEELERLTQRGIRLDESVEGHGLGLSICKDIVKLYAGSICFQSSQKLGGFLVEVKLPK